jgi:uncharacterized protein
MNRLESLREFIDRQLLSLSSDEDKRCGFVHLYGVSATAALLARLRGLDEELACTAGMLHDLASYESGDPKDHAVRSADRARKILTELGTFTNEEIQCIVSAISHHSDKGTVHGPYDELLKDADVLQHDLYNPALAAHPRHVSRRTHLRNRFHVRV